MLWLLVRLSLRLSVIWTSTPRWGGGMLMLADAAGDIGSVELSNTRLFLRHSSVGLDELAAIMADHGPTGVPDGASPCVHTAYFNTTATMQSMPVRRACGCPTLPAQPSTEIGL